MSHRRLARVAVHVLSWLALPVLGLLLWAAMFGPAEAVWPLGASAGLLLGLLAVMYRIEKHGDEEG
jgi:hypothetical protein